MSADSISGRPIGVVLPRTVDKLQYMLLVNRTLISSEINQATVKVEGFYGRIDDEEDTVGMSANKVLMAFFVMHTVYFASITLKRGEHQNRLSYDDKGSTHLLWSQHPGTTSWLQTCRNDSAWKYLAPTVKSLLRQKPIFLFWRCPQIWLSWRGQRIGSTQDEVLAAPKSLQICVINERRQYYLSFYNLKFLPWLY